MDQTGYAVEPGTLPPRPSHSPLETEVSISVLRTAALIERRLTQVVARSGVTAHQFGVLRILRGAGEAGLPTLTIRDRMIHAATGITRLLNKLEAAGQVRRERASPDRRQVHCFITERGLATLDAHDAELHAADRFATRNLNEAQQRELIALLERVRSVYELRPAPIDAGLLGDRPAPAPAG